MRAMEWTAEEEALMRENAHLGADAVAAALWKTLGKKRSVRAVEMHASRMHLSLRQRTECPRCHALGVHLSRKTGVCRLCTEELYIEEERVFNELLHEEAKARESGEVLDTAKRERLRLRQQNSRLARKHGLKGKTGR